MEAHLIRRRSILVALKQETEVSPQNERKNSNLTSRDGLSNTPGRTNQRSDSLTSHRRSTAKSSRVSVLPVILTAPFNDVDEEESTCRTDRSDEVAKSSRHDAKGTTASIIEQTDIFPPWLQDRKDFQVFFPQYAKIAIPHDELLRSAVQKKPHERNIVELQSLARWIMKIPSMTAFLDLNQALEIAKSAQYEAFAPSSYVFRTGDPGDACYLILRGEVNVLIDDEKIASVGKNNAFGDIALQLENATRGADVQVTEVPLSVYDARLGCMPGVELLKITAEDYHKTLARSQTKRKKSLISWLHNEVDIFRDCVESKLHYYELVSIDVNLKQNDIIFRQNDKVGALYVIRKGSVRFEVDVKYERRHRWPSGKREWRGQVHVSTIQTPFHIEHAGSFFGYEMFIGDDLNRQFTAIAASPTVELVALNRVDCFSPYFSFTPRAISRIARANARCNTLARQCMEKKMKDLHQEDTNTKTFRLGRPALEALSVEPRFPRTKEPVQLQFPRIKATDWEAPNETVRAFQLACP